MFSPIALNFLNHSLSITFLSEEFATNFRSSANITTCYVSLRAIREIIYKNINSIGPI